MNRTVYKKANRKTFAYFLFDRGVEVAATNSTKVGLFPIPLPLTTEQGQIVEYLDEKLAQVQRVQRHLESQIGTLVAYRKSLIHECVTGQRRVREADMARVSNSKAV
jgi:type I restriction enzyme S subunit